MFRPIYVIFKFYSRSNDVFGHFALLLLCWVFPLVCNFLVFVHIDFLTIHILGRCTVVVLVDVVFLMVFFNQLLISENTAVCILSKKRPVRFSIKHSFHIFFQLITQCCGTTIQVTDSVVKYRCMYRMVSTLFSDTNTIRLVVLVILFFVTSDIHGSRFGRKSCLEQRTTKRKYKIAGVTYGS